MSLPVPLQASFQPDLVGRLNPNAVGEAIRNGRTGAGESLKNNNGSPFDGLPTIERGSELVVLLVSNLVVRIAAYKQRAEHLVLKTWPPAHEVHPGNEVIHLDQRRADTRCNPPSQGALAGGLGAIDTDDTYLADCRVRHDLGQLIVKPQQIHPKTIAAESSDHGAFRTFDQGSACGQPRGR